MPAREVVDSRERLPQPMQGLWQPVGRRIQAERAAFSLHTAFGDDALQERSAGAIHERFHIVVVADVHERVAPVRQTQAAGWRFREMDGEPIAIGEAELRAQHQRTIRTSINAHVLAQTFAQVSECVFVDGHGASLVERAELHHPLRDSNGASRLPKSVASAASTSPRIVYTSLSSTNAQRPWSPSWFTAGTQ